VRGKVSRVWTSEPVCYLGHALYEAGALTDAQLGASLAEIASTRSLHGQILLARKVIDVAQLSQALRQQRLRKLHHAFTFPATSRFEFYAAVDLIGERPNDVEAVDPLPSIWRGIAAKAPREQIVRTLEAVGEFPIRLVRTVDLEMFSQAERQAVESLWHWPATLAELASRPGVGARTAEKLIYFLTLARLAQMVEAKGPPVASPGPPSVSVATPAGPLSVRSKVSVPGVPPRGSDEAPLSFRAPPPSSIRVPTPMSVSQGPLSSRSGSPLSSRAGAPPSSRATPQAIADARPEASPMSVRGAPAPVPPPARNPEADDALTQGEMYFVMGERQEAAACARKALAASPKMPAAMALLAAIEAAGVTDDEGKLREIVKRLDAILAWDPKCRRGHLYRARVRKRLGDNDGAVGDLRQAVARDPDDADAARELKQFGASKGESQRSGSLLDRLRGR